LSDEELLQLASDRSSLVAEANAALETEMLNRGLTSHDLARHQNVVKRYEQRETRKRHRRIFGTPRAVSWVETAVMLFWSAIAIAIIWIAYLALPTRYRFSPDWQEAALYVMLTSVAIVAVSWGSLLRKLGFWIAILISSIAQAFILHTWIVRAGSIQGGGHRTGRTLAFFVGLVLFGLVYGCGFLLRRKFYGEEAGTKADSCQ
jgi:hypothetical protein